MRALGLDLGEKRIGIAVSDGESRLATPVDVYQRTGDRRYDHSAIASMVTEWEAEIVVVGMPISLDGSIGPAAKVMLRECRDLRKVLAVPVEMQDERLTTVTAERILREAGLTAKEQRKVIDRSAAAVILQSWLDRRNQDPTT